MKLSVSRETFLARLGVAVRGASTRGPVPSLAGVLLRVEDGRAELQATDMELGVRVSLETSDSTPGQAVVPGRLLLDDTPAGLRKRTGCERLDDAFLALVRELGDGTTGSAA